jgi:hypothetical protein
MFYKRLPVTSFAVLVNEFQTKPQDTTILHILQADTELKGKVSR